MTGEPELDAVTADIPTGLTTAEPPETIRKSHNKKLIQRGTAAGAGASVALTATIAVAARGNPVISLVVVGLVGVFVAVLLAGLLTLVSWVLEMVSSRQPSPGATAWPKRYGSSAPGIGRPGRVILTDQPRSTAHGRSCAAPSGSRLSSLKPPHRREPGRHRARCVPGQAVNRRYRQSLTGPCMPADLRTGRSAPGSPRPPERRVMPDQDTYPSGEPNHDAHGRLWTTLAVAPTG
jgi:hypothetical protein